MIQRVGLPGSFIPRIHRGQVAIESCTVGVVPSDLCQILVPPMVLQDRVAVHGLYADAFISTSMRIDLCHTELLIGTTVFGEQLGCGRETIYEGALATTTLCMR